MEYKHLTRRHFLQGLGGATLALPTLSSLVSRTAMAQSGPASNVRFICLTAANSSYAHEEQWYPTGFPNQETSGGHHTIRYQNLSSLPRTSDGGLSPIIGARFNPHLDKITFLRGLDLLPRFSHNSGVVLGNFGADNGVRNYASIFTAMPTIDQVMAYSDKIYPTTPRMRSVQPVVANRGTKRWGYQNPANPNSELVMLPGHENPQILFQEFFGGFSSTPEQVDPRISILDRVLGDFRTLTRHPRLSTSDRLKVEAHGEMIHELEQRLNVSYGACNVPSEPRNHSGFSARRYPSNTDLHQYWQDHVDVVTTAMKCGLTRISTSHITRVLREYSINSGDITNGWHAASHGQGNPVADQSMININKAYAEQVFLKFLEAMDEPEDENGSYLDNTILMWCNENSTTHSTTSMPVLMAGGGGGHLRQGQYIDFSNRDEQFSASQLRSWRMTSGESGTPNKRPGLLYTRLFVSIMQAMGMQPKITKDRAFQVIHKLNWVDETIRSATTI